MIKIKFYIALGLIVFTLNACSNDNLTSPQSGDGYQQVYYNAGVQDSLAVGAVLYDYLDLGILDFTSSDSVKISFDYIAYNTMSYKFLAYHFENYPNATYLANLNVSGNQNSYKHIEFTAPSPNTSTVFYYVIDRTNRDNSYMVLQNFKVSKK